MSYWNPTNSDLYFSRHDATDPRLGDWAQQTQPQSPVLHLLGYPDDEGIRLNGGRPGAALAPDTIRKYFYKMTPRLNFTGPTANIYDLGNLSTAMPLAERHEQGRKKVQSLCMGASQAWISLGGGHDYGYADACGFLAAQTGPALVINFDAHLDVRPTDKGFHSGTPFRRMLEEFGKSVHFFEVGIQEQCNSQSHLSWCQQQGGTVLHLRDCEQLLTQLKAQLTPYLGLPLFISVDVDAFTSNEAPGCSQSWTTGLRTQDFLPALDWLQTAFKTQGLGIYEVSPSLDQDDRTAKLAALIAHRFTFNQLAKG